MSISLECPEFLFRTVNAQVGDELEISIRIGNANTATIAVTDGLTTTLLQTSGESGEHTFNYIVKETGTLLIKVYPEDGLIVVTEILLCLKLIKQCFKHKLRNLRAFIEYEGTPRLPVNLFNAFARVTFRDANNQRSVQNLRVLSTTRSSLVVPNNCSNQGVCDYWKSQVPGTNLLSNQLSDFAIQNAQNGTEVNITAKNNWLWSIPASSNPIGQDFLVAELMNSQTDPLLGIVESIQIFLLMNRIDFEEPESAAACNNYCSPDPASSFSVTITYDREEPNKTSSRSFTLFKSIDDLYAITLPASLNPDDKWDELVTFGNGIKGTTTDNNAAWTVVEFALDRMSGKGLDQCTDPVIPDLNNATADILLPVARVSSEAVFQSKCDATIEISTVQNGSGQNRKVEIKLPPTSGGTWTLSMLVGSSLQTSAPINWDASAAELQAALATIPYIGQIHNTSVLGTYNTRFDIEFVGELARSAHPDLIPNGSDLQGAGSYQVSRIQKGTNNDIQVVRKISTVVDNPFILNVLGQSTPEIRHNVSLSELTTILESLEVIGAGNVQVIGNAANATVDYNGPWEIEFIGNLAGTAIPTITCPTFGYLIDRVSTGGVGLNEKHEIRYRCSGGTFSLSFKDPQDETQVETLSNIPFDIDEVDLYNLMTTDISWFTPADLNITLIQTSDLREFVVEYTGNYDKQRMPLPLMNGAGLIGGGIQVTTLIPGSGVAEITRMIINKARGGSYRLRVNDQTTSNIPYNSTADGIKAQLKQLPLLQYSSVEVVNVNNIFTIDTGRQAGDVTISAVFQGTLLCDPLFLPAVPEPEYDYEIPDCDDQFEDYSLMFKGALFCDPGEPYPEEPVEPGVFSAKANISRQLLVQKDLIPADYGPAPTVRQVARLKNIPTDSYNAYLKTNTGYQAIAYDAIVYNQYSLVFVEKSITDLGKVTEAINKQTVLPSRMIWPIS